MGNVIDYAKLSNAAYEPNGGAPGNGWTAIIDSAAAGIGSDSGYYGLAYYHQATGELVIAHRGTEPTQWSDLSTDLELVMGKTPAQFQDAERFYAEVLKKVGFAALADLDDNSDGQIDAHDAVWAELTIWQDADSDGNQHLQQGRFTKADGSTAQMEDIWFRINPSSTRQDNPLDVSAALKVGAGGTANDGVWRDAA